MQNLTHSSGAFSIFAAFLLAISILPRVSLACDFCTALVTIDKPRADCFELQYGDLSEQIKASSASFVIFQIDACDRAANGDLVLRGAQEGISRPSSQDPIKIEQTLVFDSTRLECLQVLIEENRASLERGIVFDLRSNCT